MGKYESSYFNKEKYYDPTAGAAIADLKRQERRKRHRRNQPEEIPETQEIVEKPRPPELSDFLNEYARTFKAADPKKRIRRKRRVRNWIHAADYIRRRQGDPEFTIEKASADTGLSIRQIEQLFAGRGDISRAVNAWDRYKEGIYEKQIDRS